MAGAVTRELGLERLRRGRRGQERGQGLVGHSGDTECESYSERSHGREMRSGSGDRGPHPAARRPLKRFPPPLETIRAFRAGGEGLTSLRFPPTTAPGLLTPQALSTVSSLEGGFRTTGPEL